MWQNKGGGTIDDTTKIGDYGNDQNIEQLFNSIFISHSCGIAHEEVYPEDFPLEVDRVSIQLNQGHPLIYSVVL